jgi:IMP dehydrogenase
MVQILPAAARSLKEFRLLPGYTPADGAMPNVSLETRLCRQDDGFFRVRTPFVSAAMQAVTGVDMAIAMAQFGGIGILPVSQTIADQCAKVAAVKRFKAGFQTQIVTLSPGQSITEVMAIMAETGYSTFPVTDTGVFHGTLVGVLTDKDFDGRYDGARRVAECMRTDVQVGVAVDDLKMANQLMIQYGRGFLPIVSAEGTLLSVVFKKDLDKHIQHPHATIDAQKRLRVGAAVSTHPEDRERVQALVEHDVDVLVIDAADGHTAFQRDMLTWIKSRYAVPVIAGNVVTGNGFRFLAEAGADAVKVGMGVGSGCTTQEVKATGRGQATALMQVAAARACVAEHTGSYTPLIADGGIGSPAEMVIALALGADTLMMGNFLARFTESPGQVSRNAAGEPVKEYWMEGSRRARNHRRYAHLRALCFEEGIVGQVPHMGSIYDKLPTIMQMLQAALATAGCRTIDEFHTNAVLERQSPVALQDGQVHNMLPIHSVPED